MNLRTKKHKIHRTWSKRFRLVVDSLSGLVLHALLLIRTVSARFLATACKE